MMKLEETALANAFAVATAVLWVLCSAAVFILPAFSWQVTEWWMHGVNMSAMGGWNLTLGNFVLGGITIIISAWVTGWIFGWSWELVSNKKA